MCPLRPPDPSKARAGLSGWSAPQSRPPHLAQRLKHTAAPYERPDGDRPLAKGRRSSRSFRGFFRTSPIRVTALRAERRKVGGPPARSPARACGSTTEVVHSFSTARWRMNVGPSPAGGSPPSPDPELPGEFVSDDLRNDCARFLDELRRVVALRRQPAPDSAPWALGRSTDPQAPPNSRLPQSRH